MIEERNNLPELPKGWVWTRLGEIGIVIAGGTPSTANKEYWNGDIPWVTPADLSGFNHKFIRGGGRYLSLKGLNASTATMLPRGSILFSSRAPIGYVAIAANSISTNQGFKNLILPEQVFNEYVFYFLKASKQLAEQYGSGTTFLEISASNFAKIPLSFPPLPEQHRIVAKIEELFTRLDAGVEALKKIKTQIKRYRQSVLKHAFEGKLTAEWREKHKDKLEPASVLLERIKEERKKALGKKYQEPHPVDTTDLPMLPDGWAYTRLGEITINYDGIRVPVKSEDRKKMKGIYPYYGASGIIDYVNKYLFDGEFLLFGEDGANLLARTKPIAFRTSGKFWVNNHAHVLRTYGRIPLSYLENYLNSIDLKMSITGTAQPKLTQVSMNSIHITLPSFSEQNQIVSEIERRFSVADEIEKVIDQSLKQADRLRQSILKRAFEGKLVPQDPSDEPAEKLLERIKAERESREAEGKTQKKGKKKKRQRPWEA